MEPIALPRPPAEPEPGTFPLLASLAPVLGAVALWLLLQTPTVLVFALLGPVIALASLGDGRRSRRRRRRAEAERWRRELAEVEERLDAALEARREALREEHPGARALAAMPAHDPRRWRRQSGDPLAVVLGRGPVDSGIGVPGDVRASDPSAVRAGAVDDAERVRARAATVEGPLVVDARDGVGVVGPAAIAVARTAVLQVLEALPPGEAVVVAPDDAAWDWLEACPHELHREPGAVVRIVGDAAEATVAAATSAEGLPRECRVVVHAALDAVRAAAREAAPEALSLREAAAAARTLAEAAERAGIGARGGPPPHVALAALEQPRGGLAARFLVADEPIDLDLVRDGPHAVVGGTTGSGKSELLIAWVAAMAEGRSTEEVTFLLVDFKGGASFAALAGLAHCVGVMTDLDEAGARRAIESLRAELRRRELALAEQGARDVAEATGLPRLVIVVDEFAAMLQELPDLHRLFVDLAARGRSLGVHLVLCTQRPAEAVRDALLANCGIRVSLRVTGEQDAIAVTGSAEAASIGLEARGRCVVRVSGGRTRLAQAALAEPAQAGAARRRIPRPAGAGAPMARAAARAAAGSRRCRARVAACGSASSTVRPRRRSSRCCGARRVTGRCSRSAPRPPVARASRSSSPGSSAPRSSTARTPCGTRSTTTGRSSSTTSTSCSRGSARSTRPSCSSGSRPRCARAAPSRSRRAGCRRRWGRLAPLAEPARAPADREQAGARGRRRRGRDPRRRPAARRGMDRRRARAGSRSRRGPPRAGRRARRGCTPPASPSC
ncbi:FtsK/SpoIIIE domain-containing protein [Agrococcus sp. SL85]|uniref:FtsK/SpoIIIE domain-containing protein n=1 Tax=Agrococcus sp. SL85 TaxID=2995141 RepID=UPI00226D043F|nr:FtsK/SpoIIIE domain-containing protein [Agrococcus sp. SL85]WAC66317.1 FtsK/SpoIIIE domain-containing protein [Agrococcus sp. SL85]